jgi:hypothetical protein
VHHPSKLVGAGSLLPSKRPYIVNPKPLHTTTKRIYITHHDADTVKDRPVVQVFSTIGLAIIVPRALDTR